jgi:Fe2+ transport system protein FeoA
MDLGIVPGTQVAFERRGLTGGLSAYRVRGTSIALREEQARMIAVTREVGPARPDGGESR